MADIRKQKAEAIKRMKALKIMQQPIKEFEEEDKLNLSETSGMIEGALYWLNEDEQQMVDDFENEHDAVVYHVIKQHTTIGTLYNILYVSQFTEEWQMDNEYLKDGEVLAYVVNVDMPDCSEFRAIGVESVNGGLKRTW